MQDVATRWLARTGARDVSFAPAPFTRSPGERLIHCMQERAPGCDNFFRLQTLAREIHRNCLSQTQDRRHIIGFAAVDESPLQALYAFVLIPRQMIRVS